MCQLQSISRVPTLQLLVSDLISIKRHFEKKKKRIKMESLDTKTDLSLAFLNYSYSFSSVFHLFSPRYLWMHQISQTAARATLLSITHKLLIHLIFSSPLNWHKSFSFASLDMPKLQLSFCQKSRRLESLSRNL